MTVKAMTVVTVTGFTVKTNRPLMGLSDGGCYERKKIA
jgi:hypothetical protein